MKTFAVILNDTCLRAKAFLLSLPAMKKRFHTDAQAVQFFTQWGIVSMIRDMAEFYAFSTDVDESGESDRNAGICVDLLQKLGLAMQHGLSDNPQGPRWLTDTVEGLKTGGRPVSAHWVFEECMTDVMRGVLESCLHVPPDAPREEMKHLYYAASRDFIRNMFLAGLYWTGRNLIFHSTKCVDCYGQPGREEFWKLFRKFNEFLVQGNVISDVTLKELDEAMEGAPEERNAS